MNEKTQTQDEVLVQMLTEYESIKDPQVADIFRLIESLAEYAIDRPYLQGDALEVIKKLSTQGALSDLIAHISNRFVIREYVEIAANLGSEQAIAKFAEMKAEESVPEDEV